MKILLSAYACEPGKGSEPAVGWNWALALARRGDQVYVITRSNNRAAIESAGAGGDRRLAFSYFDLPEWARRAKRWPGGIYLYYLFWQVGAYRQARRLHARERFDVVQHSTFASFRQPSFLGGLGIPFLFGPVGGGETMPAQFHSGLPLAGRMAEWARNLGTALLGLDPLMRRTYAQARVIACTTEETRARIPERYRRKCIVQAAIGIDPTQISAGESEAPERPVFLFIGRLLYWKGLHLALRAMAEVGRVVPEARLKVIGQGGDETWLRRVARQAGVMDRVEWVASLPHAEVQRELQRATALVFPSLHDSGGMVVLEALAAGVPVVCLKLGGPGALVTPECGVAIETAGVSEAAVVGALARAMIGLAADRAMRGRLARDAGARAREMSWDRGVERVYTVLAESASQKA